jgi:uncharacterized protein YciI
VVIHLPGPAWQLGVDFREQPGVYEHVNHYQQLHEQGKLDLGGPFLLPDTVGMMLSSKGVTRDEIELFAADDPAVQSGLLLFEIRPWYTATLVSLIPILAGSMEVCRRRVYYQGYIQKRVSN